MGNNHTTSTFAPVQSATTRYSVTMAMEDQDGGSDLQCLVSIGNVTSKMINAPQARIEYYICGPLLTFFIIMGVFGNALCVKAFMNTKRRAAAAINAYLIVLAAWDLALVVTSFFLYNLTVLLFDHVPIYGNYVRTYPSLFSMANASHTASIWVVVAMASERYFALCYPLKHRRATLDHATRARRTLICISVLSILISVPKFFEVRLGECTDVDTGWNTTYVTSSELRRNQAYSILYIVIGGLLFHSLAPFSILVILSIRVIIEVRRGDVLHRQISVRRSKKTMVKSSTETSMPVSDGSRKCRRNSSKLSSAANVERSNSKKWSENKAHEILPLVVVAKFFICHTLPTVLDIFERLTSEENFEGPIIDLLVDVSNALVVMNSSVNFILYAACSVHFRRRMIGLLKIVCLCQRQKEDDFESRRSSAISPSTKRKKDGGEAGTEPLTKGVEP